MKLTRPSTDPRARIGVIAANTNWKYMSEDCGKWKGGPVVIDGIVAWPETRGLIAERLAPTLLAVSADAIERLRAKLAELDVRVQGD